MMCGPSTCLRCGATHFMMNLRQAIVFKVKGATEMDQSPPQHELRTVIVQEPDFYTAMSTLDQPTFDKFAYHHNIVNSGDLTKLKSNSPEKFWMKQFKETRKKSLNPKNKNRIF